MWWHRHVKGPCLPHGLVSLESNAQVCSLPALPTGSPVGWLPVRKLAGPWAGMPGLCPPRDPAVLVPRAPKEAPASGWMVALSGGGAGGGGGGLHVNPGKRAFQTE